ncbi:MAG: cytochrome d ubiquinol oxidase subunit II [Opitutales bacterium]
MNDLFLPGVVLISLIFYALGAGADFGGGIWDMLARGPRARRQREVIAKAIAPIWEANHVWLILILVILFTAFPASFAIIMTSLHIPMTAILIGIVLRGTAFVFRSYDRQEDKIHRRWSTVFGQASFFTPLLLGICLGALGSGEIRVEDGGLSTGFLAGWTRPFALACGLFAQGLFAFLAATYLTVDLDAEPDLQEDFRKRAILSCLLLLPGAALVFVLSQSGAPYLYGNLTQWWAPLLLLVTTVFALAAVTGLYRRRFKLARAAAVGQVSFILLGWGIAQYPYIIVPDIRFSTVRGPDETIRLLEIALLAGALLLFPSFWYLFRVFKGSRRPPVKEAEE